MSEILSGGWYDRLPGTAKSLLFAGCMCLTCSLVLTAASTGLKPFQQRNMAADRQRNILKSADLLPPDADWSMEKISRRYNAAIRRMQATPEGELLPAEGPPAPDHLPLYLYEEDGRIRAYILPVESRGLWGKIYGYMALESDGSTIKGFTVFRHNETPGLGGEIEKDWFQKNFKGKKITDRTGAPVGIHIARGPVGKTVPEEARAHYVDGISGATLTGKFLTGGLQEILAAYEPVSLRFRTETVQAADAPDGMAPDPEKE
ncbi:MAG: NADH:ubiquinone oxidoreductase subunit C [Desulfobacterales bacterium]|nr:MAG: NADH:ubiquinone oxidoreductase subunit C [Desulfobacterales bacterium]